jgi:hypothetical protein
MEKYLEDTLFDLFESYENYEDIIDSLRSLNSLGEITDDEYNEILTNYDEELNKWLDLKGKEMEMRDNNKHYVELLHNCIDYLTELWEINEKDELKDKFVNVLGFTEKDLKYFNIESEEE